MKSIFSLVITVLFLFPFVVNAAGWMDTGKTNCKIWRQNFDSGYSVTWSGKCLSGYASGTGTAIWYKKGKEIERYEGQINSGKLNGKGTYIWGSNSKWPGQKYEGDFTGGNFQGKGTFSWPNGNKYSGDLLNNKFHGKGAFICRDGKQFKGNFKNDQPVGFTIKCN